MTTTENPSPGTDEPDDSPGTSVDGRLFVNYLWYGWYQLRKAVRMAIKLAFVYSPRGVGRLITMLSRYLYDYDSAAVRHQHANRIETPEYVKAHGVRRANLKARWMVATTIGVPILFPILAWTAPRVLAWVTAAVLFVWIVKLIPGKQFWEFLVAGAGAGLVGWFLPGYLAQIPQPPWQVWPVLAVASVIGLGIIGRPQNKPILKRSALPDHVIPPPTAPVVIAALLSLGNAKMSPKTEEEHRTAIQLLTDPHRHGPGWQLDLELPPGVTAAFVMGKREEFAAALRRELGCVWPSVGIRHPGHLVVYITDVPMSRATQDPWPLMERGSVNLFEPFPAFTDQRNAWVKVKLAYASVVIGALPRMGKTYVVRQLLLAAGLDRRARVAAIDGKGTGDLSACALFADFYSRGDEPDELERVLRYLRSLKAEIQRRARVIDSLGHEEAPESKVDDRLASIRKHRLEPIVVGIDETQTYFEDAEQLCKEFVELVTYLVKKGPALGVIVILATQQVTAKTIPTSISNNAVIRFCLKVEGGYAPNDQILGTGAYKRGIDANMFDLEDKGIGYLKAEGSNPRIVRSVFGLDAPTAEKVARRCRQLRVDAGLLTGQAAGEEEQEAQPVNLLQVLLDIFGSAEKLSLAAIGAALAERYPGQYGELTNETTGALLRGLKVQPKSVRVDGVVEWGATRAQILEAITKQDSTDDAPDNVRPLRPQDGPGNDADEA